MTPRRNPAPYDGEASLESIDYRLGHLTATIDTFIAHQTAVQSRVESRLDGLENRQDNPDPRLHLTHAEVSFIRFGRKTIYGVGVLGTVLAPLGMLARSMHWI